MASKEEIIIESFKQSHPKNKYQKPKTVYEALMNLSTLDETSLEETTDFITRRSMIRCFNSSLEMIGASLSKDNTFRWPYMFAPYFTHEEVMDLREYYTAQPDSIYDKTITTQIKALEDKLRATNDPDEIHNIHVELDKLSWSGEYHDFYEEAVGTQFEPKSWDKKIRELFAKLSFTEKPEEVDQIKQQILDLGWNPEIPYNVETEMKAIKRIENIYQEKYKSNLIVDISSIVEAYNYSDTDIIEESNSTKIKPIHIVLIRGNGILSPTISKVTDGPFSHSAICIDNNFDKLYSFNMDNSANIVGGFSIESVNKYPKDNRLAVFSFFVSEDIWNKVNEIIKNLTNHIHDTAYSVVNLLLFPFKNINLNMSNQMICSQFVDSILKVAQVDTAKDSSKVTPNDLYIFSLKNSRIYKIFDGITKDFNQKKIEKYVQKMASKSKLYSESMSFIEELIYEYTYPVMIEAKLPVQFNNSGDAIIYNPLVDFDAEYSASHKLLVEYDKTKNIEGMKYELARLYYMNYELERKLYHNKFIKYKEKNMKTRARVLNDFKKYIKIVIKYEPKFNFGEYYENSVFYPHTVEVKKDTILTMKDIINHIL